MGGIHAKQSARRAAIGGGRARLQEGALIYRGVAGQSALHAAFTKHPSYIIGEIARILEDWIGLIVVGAPAGAEGRRPMNALCSLQKHPERSLARDISKGCVRIFLSDIVTTQPGIRANVTAEC